MSLRRSGLRNKSNIDSGLSADIVEGRLTIDWRFGIEILSRNGLFRRWEIFESKMEYLSTLLFALRKFFTYSGFVLSTSISNSFAGGIGGCCLGSASSTSGSSSYTGIVGCFWLLRFVVVFFRTPDFGIGSISAFCSKRFGSFTRRPNLEI
jgi:hypothetical protein